MSNRVNLGVERTVTESGYYSFSTKHDTDLVDKWLEEEGSDCWDGEIDHWENQQNENSFIDSIDVDEGEGDDSHCYYDDKIQKWKDTVIIDMNLIFSSGCEIQKITDFIKENETLFISLTKKKWEWELTEDEKKVFNKLKEIVRIFPF